MTEDEAKKTYCPILLVGIVVAGALIKVGSVNVPPETITDIMEQGYCSGSGCQMWRWDKGQVDTQGKLSGDRVLKKEGRCGLVK